MPAKQGKLTPLLMAVEANLFLTTQYLITEIQCNLESVCSKKRNALHYAIANKNVEMLMKLVYIDSDYCKMRKQKNA